MKLKIITSLIFLSMCFVPATQAQLWKKLKKKAQEKISKAEDKLIDKLDKKTDKKIDETIDGKKKGDTKSIKSLKSFGTASINHSTKYGNVLVNQLTKTKVRKSGNQFQFIGNWVTSSIDVFDGYNLQILNIESIDAINQKKTFKIPEEATLNLGYDPIKDYKGESSGEGQNYNVESGTVTVNFNKDTSVSISFIGNATLTKAILKPNGIDEYDYIKTPVSLNGMINTTSPEYSIYKERNTKSRKKQNIELSESDKTYLKEKLSPTVKIPDSFSFDKNIEVEITDDRGDKQTMEFLLGKYPDIYGISVAAKEMQGQGNVVMVMTPKSSTAFMDVAGMKMKKSTSLEQIGSQINMAEKLPEEGDFDYKKTGKAKIIVGYFCEEYKVDYNYTNQKGSASFWVSKDFPIQNVEMPMLGMKMNNPYLKGFVLELNTTTDGQNFTIKVTKVSDKNLTINTTEYRKMGF